MVATDSGSSRKVGRETLLKAVLALALGLVLMLVWGGLVTLQVVRSAQDSGRETELAAQGAAAEIDATFARFAEQVLALQPADFGRDRVAMTSRLLRLQRLLPPGAATFSLSPAGQLLAASAPFTRSDTDVAGTPWFARARGSAGNKLALSLLDPGWLGLQSGIVLSRTVFDAGGNPVGVIGAVMPQSILAKLASPAWLMAGFAEELRFTPDAAAAPKSDRDAVASQDWPIRLVLAMLRWTGGPTSWQVSQPLRAIDGAVAVSMSPAVAVQLDMLAWPALAAGVAALLVWVLAVAALFTRARAGTNAPVGFGADWQCTLDAGGLVLARHGVLPEGFPAPGEPLTSARGLDPADVGRIEAALRDQAPRVLQLALANATYRIEFASTPDGGRACTGRDVSEAVVATAARDSAIAAASAARRDQERLLAALGHDIRTPMTSIMGICQLLLDGELEPEQRNWLERAQGSCGALIGMLNGLLEVAGNEVARATVLREPVDVATLVQEVAEVLRPQARDKGLELRIRCDDLLRGQWLVDPTRLRQLVFNLASNAVKFTAAGRVEIRASAAEVDGQNRLRIAVADTGLGIDPAERELIFERFRRGSRHEGSGEAGLGLGLALCRDNATLMGGSITLESALGVGSEFTFECPAERVSAENRKLPFAGRTALIVADDAPAIRAVAGQLGEAGLMVETAPDGYLGLALAERLEAQRGALDLVILQANLAGMPGEVFVRRLRATGFGRRAVLLWVGNGPAPDEVDATLPAPPDPYEVAAAARQLLSDRPALDALEPNLSLARRGRVLLVEDDRTNQALLAAALTQRGFAVFTVGNGEEAVRLASRGSFDAILMDLQMPGIDGFEATRRIRSRPGHAGSVPVIALTALQGAGLRQHCMEAGFSAVLEKPVNLDRLGGFLHRCIGEAARSVIPASTEMDYVADVSSAFLEEMVAVVGLERARACVAEFITDATARCRRLSELLPGWEVDAILRSCEEISGMAETCGALALGELLEEIADTATRNDRDAAEMLIPRLDAVIERLPQAMTTCLDDVARRWSRGKAA